MTISEIFAGLTTFGLFFSVLLVYLELRRNGIATRLNNNLIFTERHFNLRNAMFSKNFSEVVVRGRKSLANLDEAEHLIFKIFLLHTAQTAKVMLLAADGQLESR